MKAQKVKKITKNSPVGKDGCLNTLNDLLEGCQIIDYNWRYLYVNAAAARQGHREPEELLHHTMMEIYPGIETTELFTVLRDCMDNRVVRQMVNNFTYPDRSNGWFELSIQPVPEGIFILSMDITERKRAENKALQLARLYATLSQVNQTIVRVKERDELYQSICSLAVEFGKFDLAWIGLLDEETGKVIPFTANGLDVKQWPFPIVNINQGSFQNGMVALAIRTSQVVVSNDVQVDERTGAFQEKLPNFAYHASAVIPFQLNDKTIGVLNLVSHQRGIFEDEQELNLLNEMGLDISFALASIQTEHERRAAQEQLLESEHRFHSIYANATIGMYRTTPDGQILMANPALVQMMGYASFEELSQRKLIEDGFQSGYERDKFQSKISLNGEVRGFESGWMKKDGTPFFGRESAKAIKDAAGNILYYEGTVEDITDRKQAELALQASEENYRRLVENSESAIAVLDQDGQILYANSWAIKVWNDPEIVGRSVFDIYPEEYARPYLKAIRKVIHTQTAIVDEVESLVKEHIMWFRISMTPLKSPAGIVDRVLLNAWDITDSKQTEEAISRLAKFPSENPNPVVRLDKSGLILYANLASSPLLNKWEREVEQQVPEDWQEQIATVLQSGHLLETEMVCEERIFSLTVAPITDKGYVNIYAKDITERKQAEAELLFRNVLLSTQQEAAS